MWLPIAPKPMNPTFAILLIPRNFDLAAERLSAHFIRLLKRLAIFRRHGMANG